MPGGKHVLGQGKNRIFGTAKVGDRGQIVIPQEARRFYGISPGDTLLILGNEASGLVVTRPEILNDLADEILGKEEEYWDWTTTQLDLVEKMGIENYIQSQI